jgi:hypothetical protein
VLYKEQAKYQDAEDLLIEAVEGRIQRLGRQHPDTTESLNTLINLYKAWNKPDEAGEWREELRIVD